MFGGRLAGDRRRWEAITAAALLAGYAGYYLCRSNLAVVAPQLLAQFGPRGLDKTALGLVSSTGVFAYAAGKLVNGVAADMAGGRRLFLAGMVGSILATVAFGVSGTAAAFVTIWAVNRFAQSTGWGALVKIASHWYSPAAYGRVMAVLSLSFLFGDAIGRMALGSLVAAGAGWRTVFFVSAASLLGVAVVCALTLHDTPRDVGFQEPPVSPRNVYGEAGAESRATGIADAILPYLRSPSFWMVCLVSLGLTLVREAFNAWTPVYLVETYGLTHASAAQASAIFPFVGGVSVLCVGALADRVTVHRLAVAVPLLVGGVGCLVAIGSAPVLHDVRAALVLLAATSFCVLGPYSLLAGAIAVDLGGRRGSATAAGLIDTAGYLGAVLSGAAVGAVAQHRGWASAFHLLAVVTALSAVASAACWLERRAAYRSTPISKELRHAD